MEYLLLSANILAILVVGILGFLYAKTGVELGRVRGIVSLLRVEVQAGLEREAALRSALALAQRRVANEIKDRLSNASTDELVGMFDSLRSGSSASPGNSDDEGVHDRPSPSVPRGDGD